MSKATGVVVEKQSEYISAPTGLRALDGHLQGGGVGRDCCLVAYSGKIRSHVYYTCEEKHPIERVTTKKRYKEKKNT